MSHAPHNLVFATGRFTVALLSGAVWAWVLRQHRRSRGADLTGVGAGTGHAGLDGPGSWEQQRSDRDVVTPMPAPLAEIERLATATG